VPGRAPVKTLATLRKRRPLSRLTAFATLPRRGGNARGELVTNEEVKTTFRSFVR
jgi:hypothetical protein